MRTVTIAIFMVFILVIVACTVTRQVAYELPVTMAEPVKIQYAKLCEKGKMLYDINCAKCHTTKKHGKEFIPDFTAEQLEVYKIRVGNIKHENNVSEEQVSAEELGQITTFLNYKKRNGNVQIGITNK